ncbi:MAG: hypothetical protein AABX89_00185 [Candidatus Thermoplasmatota archaeon]
MSERVRIPRSPVGGQLVLLVAAGALEGLLLANGPFLNEYAAVRLGPRGAFVNIVLLSALSLAAFGALAATMRWARMAFLAVLAAAVTWSLARSSLHPWWLFSSEQIVVHSPPNGATIAAHVFALALACAATLLDALAAHRLAARREGMPEREMRAQSRRLAAAGFSLLVVASVLTLVLPAALDSLAGTLQGAVSGSATLVLLGGSALTLALGLGLLVVRPQVERTANLETKSGDAEI